MGTDSGPLVLLCFMTVNYIDRVTDAFIGNATIWTGTAVPFGTGNLSGGQPTAGSLLGLQEQGDVVTVSFKTGLQYLRYEGDFADSEATVIEEALTISGSCATLYGANGKAAWELLSGGRIAGSGTFGATSGGSYGTFACTVVGYDLSTANFGKGIIVSGYRMACEEFSFSFSKSGLSKVNFTLKGMLHTTISNGMGKIFYV